MQKLLKLLVLASCIITLLAGIAGAVSAAAPETFMEIPWGASPQEVRQTMEKNGFSFWEERTDDTLATHYVTYADGLYAGYSVTGLTFGFMSQKVYYVKVQLTDKRVNINNAYKDLKNLLTEKYGQPKPEKILQIPVHMPPQRTYMMDEYISEWSLADGSNQPFMIVLEKNPSWGIINVSYTNNSLKERLKSLSRQNI